MSRAHPARLVMTGETDDVVVGGERILYRCSLLEAIHAQEFDVLAGCVAQVRVMTADAFHPVFFERNGGRPLTGSALAYLRRDRRIVQLTVARRLRAVEGERDGMVVGEIHAELAGETGGGTEPFRYGIAGAYAGAGEIDDGILHPIEHVNGAEGERAVMTRQAQLGFGARLAEIDGVE